MIFPIKMQLSSYNSWDLINLIVWVVSKLSFNKNILALLGLS